MSGSFDENGVIDPAGSTIVFCTGRKGSGKSVMCNLYAMQWPYDLVVIDVAGDDGPRETPRGQGSHDRFTLRGTVDDLPRKWPEHWRHEERPMIIRYVPDAGSPTELEDMDTVVGMTFAHSGNPKPAMLVIHEIGRVAPVNRTPANMRRVLNHNRHRNLTIAMAGPRPQTVDTLVIAQADLCYVYDLPSPRDRRRVAETIGWDPTQFDALVDELKPYEHLRHDAREPKPEPGDTDRRLIKWEPLPADVVTQVNRWRDGTTYAPHHTGGHP